MTHAGSRIERVDGVDVIDCETCRFAHVHPLPTAAALDALYDREYYADLKPRYFAEAEEDRGWWDLVYRERLELMERWLQDDLRRSILDVGSGPGAFLVAARTRGWTGIGFEPNELAAKYSTDHFGLTVYQRSFNDEAVDTFNGFDVVNLGEVLEHVLDPAATLKLAYRALAPGGLLHLVVPNDFNLLQHALLRDGQHPYWIVPREHLNYFTVQTLYALVRRCGFSVGDLSTTFPMELFQFMGLNYVGDDETGRKVHAMRKRLELKLDILGLSEAKRELYRTLAKYGVGRDIVLLARKPSAQTPPELRPQ